MIKVKPIAVGNTAEVFDYGNKKVCKLFFEGYPLEAINREYTNAKLMKSLGLHVPKCHEIIQYDHRSGIIYEKVYGKTLLEYFFETADLHFLVRTLTHVHKKILKHHTQNVLSYKTFLIQSIPDQDIQKSRLINEIRHLPDGDTLCHGDYHPGNILVGSNHKTTLIDFMNVCHGPWQYDIARTYYLLAYANVPRGSSSDSDSKSQQKDLADLYLSKLNVSFKEIAPFLSIIDACRSYEKA